MRISICINDKKKISAAKAAGFEAFEFSGAVLATLNEKEFEELCKEAELQQMPCVGINAYSSGKPVIIGENYSEKEAEEHAHIICSRAAKLKAPFVGIGAPKARMLPEGWSIEQGNEQLEEFLKGTAEIAEKYGITLLVEALQPNICNYLNKTSEANDIVKKMERENVKLVFDFYHSKMAGEDVCRSFVIYADSIMHVHFSTADGPTFRSYPVEEDLEEYRTYFNVLKDSSYKGDVSVEPGEFDAKLAEKSASMLKKCRANVF